MSWLLAVLGGLLLLLLFFEVFETVFHPGGRGGPIYDRQNRMVWEIFRTVGVRRDGTPREGLLSRSAPLMAPFSLAVWAAVLILGFALIYLPWMDSFLVPDGHLRGPLLESIYYSAMIATSAGNGDLVANLQALRMVSVFESVSGLALVSVTVSYLINIYGHQGEADTIALSIQNLLDGRQEHLLALREPVAVDSVARQVESISEKLGRMLQAYEQYPILHYFRPRDSRESLPVQVGRLLSLLGSLEGSALAVHPSMVPLQRTVKRYIFELSENVVPAGFEPVDPSEPVASSEARYDRVLRYLRYR